MITDSDNHGTRMITGLGLKWSSKDSDTSESLHRTRISHRARIISESCMLFESPAETMQRSNVKALATPEQEGWQCQANRVRNSFIVWDKRGSLMSRIMDIIMVYIIPNIMVYIIPLYKWFI